MSLTLSNVKDKIQSRHEGIEDIMISNRDLFMDDEGKISINGSESINATPTFHRQIANRAGIPFSYYKKLHKDPTKRDLLADNFNRMNLDVDEKRLVRTLDGRARAYLSDRYLKLDNNDLIKSLAPKLEGMDSSEISMTNDFLHIKLLSPKEHDITVGDPVRMGYIVSNSETGLGTLTVKLFVHRLVCDNGMVGQDDLMKFSQVHLGSRSKGGMSAIWDSVNKSIDAVMSDDTVDKMIGNMKFASSINIGEDEGLEGIDKACKRLLMSPTEITQTKENYISWNDTTAWGLSNALTRTATMMEDRNRATDLQKFGGMVMRDLVQEFEKYDQNINASKDYHELEGMLGISS